MPHGTIINGVGGVVKKEVVLSHEERFLSKLVLERLLCRIIGMGVCVFLGLLQSVEEQEKPTRT